MTITIYTKKDHYKRWKSESEFPFPELGERKAVSIYTAKDARGALVTRVSVHTVAEDGRSHVHAIFADYSRTWERDHPSRVTASVAEAQQKRTLDKIEEVKAEIVQYYADKAAKEAACSPL